MSTAGPPPGEPVAAEDAVVVRQMLELALDLAEEAIERRQRDGDNVYSATLATGAIESPLEALDRGELTRRSPSLGLSRGAGDFEWRTDEDPLIRLFDAIDRYWGLHVWDRVDRTPRLPVRHVKLHGRHAEHYYEP
jgi:hypothetical protein